MENNFSLVVIQKLDYLVRSRNGLRVLRVLDVFQGCPEVRNPLVTDLRVVYGQEQRLLLSPSQYFPIMKTALHQPALLFNLLHISYILEVNFILQFSFETTEGEIALERIHQKETLFQAAGGGTNSKNRSLDNVWSS